METPFRYAAVILAAGASSRMGRPKLVLPWHQTTIVGHLLDLWQQLGACPIAIVLSAKDSVIAAELDRSSVQHVRINNPRPELGMFESIRAAARWEWDPAISHFALILGDQPHIRQPTLKSVLKFAAVNAGRICQPARNGRGRHPVILPRAIFRTLPNSTAAHLKDFMLEQSFPPERIELDDPGLDLDIDTPEDYKRASATQDAPVP